MSAADEPRRPRAFDPDDPAIVEEPAATEAPDIQPGAPLPPDAVPAPVARPTLADLGERGTYYRAQIPFASQNEASEFCSSLKAAGGQCVVAKN